MKTQLLSTNEVFTIIKNEIQNTLFNNQYFVSGSVNDVDQIFIKINCEEENLNDVISEFVENVIYEKIIRHVDRKMFVNVNFYQTGYLVYIGRTNRTKSFCNVMIYEKKDYQLRAEIVTQNGERILFDPITVLCDLANMLTYTDKMNLSTYSLKNFDHPFLKISDVKNDFKLCLNYKPDDIGFQDVYTTEYNEFLIAINEIREAIENNHNYDLGQFELMKSFSEILYTFEIETEEGEGNFVANYFGNNFEIKELIHEMISTGNSIRYNYSCFKIHDLIYAVWHYLILYNYRFSKCIHCDRYFMTQSFKTVYCNRRSPMKEYSRHICKNATKRASEKFTRRRKNRTKTMELNHFDKLYDFMDAVDDYKQTFDNRRSHVYLSAMLDYLSSENMKKNWYTK